MDLTRLLNDGLYFHNIVSSTHEDVIKEMIESVGSKGIVSNTDILFKDIMDREKIATTFMDNNVSIPHCKSDNITKTSIVCGVSKNNIKDSQGNIANIFFMILVPSKSESEHLEILTQLASFVLNEDFCKDISKTNALYDVKKVFIKYSDSKKAEANINKNIIEEKNKHFDLVAITACPVGIAHTYIAAEKLEKVANEMGYTIKVQTNGSIGIKNALTEDDIKHAKAVIIASDVETDKSLFDGKVMVEYPVAQAIKNTEKIINDALSAKSVYKDSGASQSGGTGSKGGKLGVYSHLLTGVSFMIPFIVIGGVLIALSIALSGIEPGKGAHITNPILSQLNDIGVLSFGLMIPILAGYIAFSIAGKPALAPAMVGGVIANNMHTGFLGGIVIGFAAGYFIKLLIKIPVHKYVQTVMPILILPVVGVLFSAGVMYLIGSHIAGFMDMLTETLKGMQGSGIILAAIIGTMIAVDMGGPINKVAFLFGASMITAGVPQIMGCVAVAVCTPPLGMALSTFIAPNKYHEDEKQAGKAAFFMGLIGITEGAIPFAAADPIRVIPSLMVGSAAGAIAAYIGKVADYAPHGGFIVLPVIDNKISFVIAALIGIAVTATVVTLLKSNKNKVTN